MTGRVREVLGFVVGVLVAGLVAGAGVAGAALPAGALLQVSSTPVKASESYVWDWSEPDLFSLYPTGDGKLAVVEREQGSTRLTVRIYDPATLAEVGPPKVVTNEWDRWGHLYAAPDGNFYVMTGRNNLDEDDSLDVIAVRRYDPDWNLTGTAYLKGGASQGGYTQVLRGISEPFDAAAADMVLVGDRLVIHTSRLNYTSDEDGLRHQSNLTIEVDTTTMTAKSFQELAGGAWPYTGHSFRQLVAMNGNDLVTVDHGDAYDRGVEMTVTPDYPSQRQVHEYELFSFSGEVGNNATGARVTDLISGPQGMVVLGSSIRHQGGLGSPFHEAEKRNAFALTAATDGSHQMKWLTSFAPNGNTEAGETRAVEVGPDRYAALFSVRQGGTDRLAYRLLDSAGNVHASANFPGLFYPTVSQPVRIGDRIFWAGPPRQVPWDSFDIKYPYLFGLDISDPANPKLDPRATPPTVKVKPRKTVAGKPRIKGAARVGIRLKAVPGKWKPAKLKLRYRWFAGRKKIRGATSRRYRIPARMAGKKLRVKVTGSKPGFQTRSAWSRPTRKVRR